MANKDVWITSYKDIYGRFVTEKFNNKKQAIDFEKLVVKKLGPTHLSKGALLRARKVTIEQARKEMSENPIFNQSRVQWLD